MSLSFLFTFVGHNVVGVEEVGLDVVGFAWTNTHKYKNDVIRV